MGFPGGSVGKDSGSIPGLGRSPGEGSGTSFWYSCWKNPLDRGAWWATAHGAAKSQNTTELLFTQRMHPRL